LQQVPGGWGSSGNTGGGIPVPKINHSSTNLSKLKATLGMTENIRKKMEGKR